MTREDFEKILEIYTLEEILELNELTEAELLQQLWDNGFIELPETLPVDTYNGFNT